MCYDSIANGGMSMQAHAQFKPHSETPAINSIKKPASMRSILPSICDDDHSDYSDESD